MSTSTWTARQVLNNGLRNASGDASADLAGWVPGPTGGGVVNLAAYDNGTAHETDYYIETNTSTPQGSLYQDVDVPLSTGQSYSLTTWVRARGKAAVCLVLYGMAAQPEDQGASCATVTDTWRQLSVQFDVPGDQTYTGLRAQLIEGTPGVNIDIDGASLSP